MEKIEKLSAEISEMCERDQKMRNVILKTENWDNWDESIDRENTEEVKKILAEFGWLKISEFGEKVADKIWLLVQHADHDVDFQKVCLEMMEKLPMREVSQESIAFLTDRILINEGKPQIYGTQFCQSKLGAKCEPRPIENMEKMRELREKAGMETFEENYARMLRGDA